MSKVERALNLAQEILIARARIKELEFEFACLFNEAQEPPRKEPAGIIPPDSLSILEAEMDALICEQFKKANPHESNLDLLARDISLIKNDP